MNVVLLILKSIMKEAEPVKSFYAALNKFGVIEYPVKTEILQIASGDTVLFHLNDCSVLGTDLEMILNLPITKYEKLHYPINNPLEHCEELISNLTKIKAKPSLSEGIGIFFEVVFTYPGSFFFQLSYPDVTSKLRKCTKPDWIQVIPKCLPPANSMVLLSVLTRCLGKLKNWIDLLANQAKLGYNMIHFMPIQKYGESGSMYSLRDHQTIDDWYVDDITMLPAGRLAQLERVIETLNKRYGLRCLVDIVLNHVYPQSEWLQEHPEAAYNLSNTPHLRVAWEYDKFLQSFSINFMERKFPECPSAPFITDENDLKLVMKLLEAKVKELTLASYFKYDKAKIKEKWSAKETKIPQMTEAELIEYLKSHSHNYGVAPYGVYVLCFRFSSQIARHG